MTRKGGSAPWSIAVALLFLCQYGRSLTTPIQRGLVPSPLGMVHYQAVGLSNNNNRIDHLLPIVAFHTSPRSSDEFRQVLEECASTGRTMIAFDQLGHGRSDNPPDSCTLDEIVDCLTIVLDRLGIARCIVAGSFTGCCLALSMASRYPERVVGVVCSNLYHHPPAARERALLDENQHLSSPTAVVDNWNLRPDGSHINQIWDKRSGTISVELNTRIVLEEYQYLVLRRERYERGIHVQEAGAFPLPNACWNTFCPVLCIRGAQAFASMDAKGMEMSRQFDQAMTYFIHPPSQVTIQGGSLYMLNEQAGDWLALVHTFAQTLEARQVQSPFYDQQIQPIHPDDWRDVRGVRP